MGSDRKLRKVMYVYGCVNIQSELSVYDYIEMRESGLSINSEIREHQSHTIKREK